MNDNYTETQFVVELEQQVHSFVDLNTAPYTVKAFIEHLREAYS